MKDLQVKGKEALRIEKKYDIKLEKLLHLLYIEQQLSVKQIEEMLEVSHVTINKWLIGMGIKRRFIWREIVDEAFKMRKL